VPVLLLPLIPTVIALAAYRVGVSRGCVADSATACVIAGTDIADVVQLAMAAAWLVVFGVWAPALIATSIVHNAMDGFGPRLLAGGVLPAGVIVGSVIAPTIASAILKPDACSLQALGPQCRLFGADMQQALALAGIQPWPLLLVTIPAMIYVVIYMVILSVDGVAERRRYVRALREAEAHARQAGLPPPIAAQFQRKHERPRKPLVYIPPKRKPRTPV
jgi:hypothetical protein